MELNNQYTLPELHFVAGSTQDFEFSFYSDNHRRPFDLSACEANFSMVPYMHRESTPFVNQSMTILQNMDHPDKPKNILAITLTPDLTLNHRDGGKCIYQITIRDVGGETESYQGLMHIKQNISKNPVYV